MAKFNESFERIRDESQSLQKKHFGVKAQARHQAQSVEAIKTLITELTKDKDVRIITYRSTMLSA